MPDEHPNPDSDQPNATPVSGEGQPADSVVDQAEAGAAEARRRRSDNRFFAVAAWGLVALAFLVLIYSAVAGAYERRDGTELDFALAERELQVNVEQVELGRRSSLPIPDSEPLPIDRHVRNRSAEDVWAARILAVISFENGDEVPEAVLELLASSDSESDRAIAVLYGQGEFDRQQANAIEQDVAAAFSYRLATVHALERLGDEDVRARLLDTRMFVRTAAVGLSAGVLACLGLVVIVIYFIRRSTGSAVPVGYPGFRDGILGADRSALRFGLYFVAFFMLSIVVVLREVGVTEAGVGVLHGVLVLVVILVIIAMPIGGITDSLKRVFGRGEYVIAAPIGGVADSLKRVFGRSARWRNLVGAGALAYVATVPLLGISILLMIWLTKFFPSPMHPIGEQLSSASPLSTVLLFTSAIILAPITEELAFRGLLFPALAERLKSPWGAMIVSALLFAAIHPQGPAGWPPLIVVGFMAALVTYQTGSLLPAIVLHALHNAFSLTAERFIG